MNTKFIKFEADSHWSRTRTLQNRKGSRWDDDISILQHFPNNCGLWRKTNELFLLPKKGFKFSRSSKIQPKIKRNILIKVALKIVWGFFTFSMFYFIKVLLCFKETWLKGWRRRINWNGHGLRSSTCGLWAATVNHCKENQKTVSMELLFYRL